MAGIADKAWAAGWNVVRLNQRNCGQTEHLSRGLYHSGLTHDPLFVLRELVAADGLRTLAVAGYSLGGNLALKLAGELGDDAAARAEGGLRRVADDGPGRVRAERSSAGRTSRISGTSCATSRSACGARRPPIPGDYSLEPLATRVDGAPVRRGLHRAPSRLPRRRPTTTTAPAPSA